MSSGGHITDCGLPGIKDIPYGVHMCHFYRSRDDLVDTLLPYLAAGLRRGERCIWVTANPLGPAQAKRELQRAGIDRLAQRREGSLLIHDHEEWYERAGAADPAKLVELCLAEERRALADGFDGVRLTGNLGFVTPSSWPTIMKYEAMLDRAFQATRIVALCSYGLSQVGATEVMEVVARHHCTLERPDSGWQLHTR